MATVLWGAPITDTPTWSVPLSGLAIGTYSLSSIIDNTSGLYENALVNFVSTVSSAAIASMGFIGFTALYAPDGINFPSPPGATAAATGIPQTAAIVGLTGATFTTGHTLPFLILPMRFKLLLYNGLGVAGPTGTVTVTLNRWAETVT